jgi:ribonucleotide monophosphatase NagD (HAD superfamily)
MTAVHGQSACPAGLAYVTQTPARIVGKPSAQVVEVASGRRGLPAEEIVVVGDDPASTSPSAAPRRRHGAC